jgi:hypothetical protein
VPNLRAVGQFGEIGRKILLANGHSYGRGPLNRGSFRAQQLRSCSDMESSVEALRLRRMRVQNEISLTKKRDADRAEDLEALREELLRLSKQIEEIER